MTGGPPGDQPGNQTGDCRHGNITFRNDGQKRCSDCGEPLGRFIPDIPQDQLEDLLLRLVATPTGLRALELMKRLRTELGDGLGVDDLLWVWPRGLADDLTEWAGIPVQHCDVDEPMLAHQLREEPLAEVVQLRFPRGDR